MRDLWAVIVRHGLDARLLHQVDLVSLARLALVGREGAAAAADVLRRVKAREKARRERVRAARGLCTELGAWGARTETTRTWTYVTFNGRLMVRERGPTFGIRICITPPAADGVGRMVLFSRGDVLPIGSFYFENARAFLLIVKLSMTTRWLFRLDPSALPTSHRHLQMTFTGQA